MARRPSYKDVRPVDDLITEEEMMEARVWLDNNPRDWGQANGRLRRAEARTAMAEAIGINVSDEKSADKRKADARTSAAYDRAVEEEADALSYWAEMKARRESMQTTIEIWRTLRADKRMREEVEASYATWEERQRRANRRRDGSPDDDE